MISSINILQVIFKANFTLRYTLECSHARIWLAQGLSLKPSHRAKLVPLVSYPSLRSVLGATIIVGPKHVI